MAIVGAPDYLCGPGAPSEPQQLVDHRCINLRLPNSDTQNAWRLIQAGREMRVRVEGPPIFNTIDCILDADVAGLGLACLPFNLENGRLVRVLGEWTPPPACHLYYPSRRHASAAFRLSVEALRYRGLASPGKARASDLELAYRRSAGCMLPTTQIKAFLSVARLRRRHAPPRRGPSIPSRWLRPDWRPR